MQRADIVLDDMPTPRSVKTLALISAAFGTLGAQTTVPNTFLVHNLVSDLPGIADHQDPKLVNPWGNGFGQQPFWVGNNGTGTSTLYDGYGVASATVVSIPSAGSTPTGGPVTGVISNAFSSNANVLDVAAGKPASFIFCSEDGVISGWNSSVDATHAKVVVDNSKLTAVYKGCALGGTSTAPLIFAANFNSGAVDVFDGSFTPLVNAKAFVDAAVPAGFAPFNVAILSGNVYVTYAKQDSKKEDDVAGAGNGYVAVFGQTGNLLGTVISQGALNSPWGLAIAPATFGAFGGSLLVGNFGDGKINAYNITTGKLNGTLNDAKGNPISIPGLWSINFGSGARNEDPGTLYFTAGIGGGPNNDPVESHGLLGSIQGVPNFPVSGVQSAASFLAGPIAPNAWMMIRGNELSATSAQWQVSGNTLPTTVAGVSVTVNGEAAPVNFVSNTQINFLVPADIQPGTAQIVVTNNGLTSATVSVPVSLLAPAFFSVGAKSGTSYVFAAHGDFSLIGPTGLLTGVTTTPAKQGEEIVIVGTGFGQTSPAIPNGQVVSTALVTPSLPTIVIDGIVAQVVYGALIGPGVYQYNVFVPKAAAAGDDLVVALMGNGVTQANAFLTVAAAGIATQ
jgi:uncharacterized protein (TIGR03118 family)